jgi:hypothetical protein
MNDEASGRVCNAPFLQIFVQWSSSRATHSLQSLNASKAV